MGIDCSETGEAEHELIASYPVGPTALIQPAGYRGGDGIKHVVTPVMAQEVVEANEIVEVADDDRSWAAIPEVAPKQPYALHAGSKPGPVATDVPQPEVPEAPPEPPETPP